VINHLPTKQKLLELVYPWEVFANSSRCFIGRP